MTTIDCYVTHRKSIPMWQHKRHERDLSFGCLNLWEKDQNDYKITFPACEAHHTCLLAPQLIQTPGKHAWRTHTHTDMQTAEVLLCKTVSSYSNSVASESWGSNRSESRGGGMKRWSSSAARRRGGTPRESRYGNTWPTGVIRGGVASQHISCQLLWWAIEPWKRHIRRLKSEKTLQRWCKRRISHIVDAGLQTPGGAAERIYGT